MQAAPVVHGRGISCASGSKGCAGSGEQEASPAACPKALVDRLTLDIDLTLVERNTSDHEHAAPETDEDEKEEHITALPILIDGLQAEKQGAESSTSNPHPPAFQCRHLPKWPPNHEIVITTSQKEILRTAGSRPEREGASTSRHVASTPRGAEGGRSGKPRLHFRNVAL